MIRPKLVVVNNERDEESRSIRDGKGVHFHLSRSRVVVYVLSLMVSLCFMFTLGIFVGRGIPVVRSDDFSVKGRFLRFLGLDRRTGAAVPDAAATWKNQKKMVDSLNYYQDLTSQNLSPLGTPSQAGKVSAAVSPATPAKEDKSVVTGKEPPVEQPAAAPPPVKPPMAATPGSGRYTLLVASLKERDARPLVKKLKADGYSPLVETLEFGASKWSRILLGAFPTRKAAIAFAEQFNRKEKTQALVISGAGNN